MERDVTIPNKQGLHARPVMRFVDTAAKYASDVRVMKDGQDVDGKSPMEMMLLGAGCGSVLRITATGDDAEQALDALTQLVNDGFGEE